MIKLSCAGKGAWQKWQYEMEVLHRSLTTSDSLSFSQKIVDISQTNLTVTSLLPLHQYAFRVRAYSYAGFGPWSNLFISGTLSAGLIFTSIV